MPKSGQANRKLDKLLQAVVWHSATKVQITQEIRSTSAGSPAQVGHLACPRQEQVENELPQHGQEHEVSECQVKLGAGLAAHC